MICTDAACGASIPPLSGSYLSWLGGANAETAEIRQTATLPAGKPAFLSYAYQLLSNDYCGYDYGYVQVIVNGVTRTLKRYSLCTSAETNAWTGAQFDLSAYAGSRVTVVFRARTDYSYSSSFFVDDVAITQASTCTAAVAGVERADDVLLMPEGGAPAKPNVPAGASSIER